MFAVAQKKGWELDRTCPRQLALCLRLGKGFCATTDSSGVGAWASALELLGQGPPNVPFWRLPGLEFGSWRQDASRQDGG